MYVLQHYFCTKYDNFDYLTPIFQLIYWVRLWVEPYKIIVIRHSIMIYDPYCNVKITFGKPEYAQAMYF